MKLCIYISLLKRLTPQLIGGTFGKSEVINSLASI